MISNEAVNEILGITEKVPLSSEEMISKMRVTFFPYDEKKVDEELLHFFNKLKSEFINLGIEVIPFGQSLKHISYYSAFKRVLLIILRNLSVFIKRVFYRSQDQYINLAVIGNTLFVRDRVKPGISIIAIDGSPIGRLPMDTTLSFKDTSVVTVVKLPDDITADSDFHYHFDNAMNFFAYHMTNVVIAVRGKDFVVYNFNASHPFYENTEEGINKCIVESLVPKVVAPIRPHKFSDFEVLSKGFSINDEIHSPLIKDFIDGGSIFEKTGLYPKGKKIDDLPFRNNFYKWIGKIHLDNRNGMSYGFLAWQMPVHVGNLLKIEHDSEFVNCIEDSKDFFFYKGDFHLILNIRGENFCLKIPQLWVLSQRSGANKTNIDPSKDLIKIGIHNGKMFIQSPEGLLLDNGYKPSFDTKVILAHAVGNYVMASVFNHLGVHKEFVDRISKVGIAMAHWHGYLNPDFIPKGWHSYGEDNPHVSCSSPQSAVYALQGKIRVMEDVMEDNKIYKGDIQIEPHHGTNINYTTISDLATLFVSSSEVSSLGNKYLFKYKRKSS